MGIVVAVVAVVVLVATYLTWTASRLDRLHARVEASAAALDGQLVRRAAAAATLATGAGLPREVSAPLAAAAAAARSGEGLGPAREAVENALSRALQTAAAAVPGVFHSDLPDAVALRGAATKVAFARRFHNDAVKETLAVRRRRVPRLLRLAGTAPLPEPFEIDDTVLVPSMGAGSPLG